MQTEQKAERLMKNFYAMSDKKQEWILALSDICVAEQQEPPSPLVIIISSTPGE